MSLSNKAIQDFCQSQIDLYPHLRPQYEKIQSYCIQRYFARPPSASLGIIADIHRLWYQLTQFLIEFINDPKTSSGQNYVDVFAFLSTRIMIVTSCANNYYAT